MLRYSGPYRSDDVTTERSKHHYHEESPQSSHDLSSVFLTAATLRDRGVALVPPPE